MVVTIIQRKRPAIIAKARPKTIEADQKKKGACPWRAFLIAVRNDTGSVNKLMGARRKTGNKPSNSALEIVKPIHITKRII
jgi:hypothetical protein